MQESWYILLCYTQLEQIFPHITNQFLTLAEPNSLRKGGKKKNLRYGNMGIITVNKDSIYVIYLNPETMKEMIIFQKKRAKINQTIPKTKSSRLFNESENF